MTKRILQAEYMRKDTPFPRYLPYPIFLFETDLTMTARVVYALLLNRVSLSQMNGWVDAAGIVFVIYTIESIAHDIHKGQTTVKKALAELEEADLLERRREDFGRPNHLYVKTVPQPDFPYTEKPDTVNPTSRDRTLTVTGTENSPIDSRETKPLTGESMATNNLIQNPDNRDMNPIASLHKYGCDGSERYTYIQNRGQGENEY